jgi:head-tail adaptor
MQPQTSQEHSPQPLPDHFQEQVWAFVRAQIRKLEDQAGARMAQYEVRVTEAGQIEVAVTATQDPYSAALAAGLEDANRTGQRENLSEELGGAKSE